MARRNPEELPWYRWLFELFRTAVEEFASDHVGRMGAALAFYTLFAMVPLLFLASAAAGFLLGDPGQIEAVISRVEDVVGAQVASQIEEILRSVSEQAGASLGIGLGLAAITASGVVVQVQVVINQIFHAPEPEDGGIVRWLLRRAFAVLVAVVLAILVLTPLGAVAAVNFLAALVPPDLAWLEPLLRLGVPLVSLGMLVVVVGLTFQVFTRQDIPWEAARRGGLFTAVLGLAAAFGVGTYLSRTAGGDQDGLTVSALGVIGGVAILLVFFNLLWQVYLFGAEVTKVYADYLRYGEILRPGERAEREQQEQAREAAPQAGLATGESDSGESAIKVGAIAFVLGLMVGRWQRRE